jgi:hypothetical protein
VGVTHSAQIRFGSSKKLLLASSYSCKISPITDIHFAQEIVQLATDHFYRFNEHTLVSQKDKLRAFFTSLSMAGEYRTVSIFIHHFFPVLLGFIVPTLADCPKSRFLLRGMAHFASLPQSQILQDGFYNYYRVLALEHPPDVAHKAFAFLRSKHELDFCFVAMNILQVGT